MKIEKLMQRNVKLRAENAKLQTELQALAEAAQAVVDANVPGGIRGLYRAIDKLSEVLEQ